MNAQRSQLFIKASTALILLASTACSNKQNSPAPSPTSSTSPAPSPTSSTSPAPSPTSSPQPKSCKVGDTSVYVYDRAPDKKSYKPRKDSAGKTMELQPRTEVTILLGTEVADAIPYTALVEITQPVKAWINKKGTDCP